MLPSPVALRRAGFVLLFAVTLPGLASPQALTFLQSFRDAPIRSFSGSALSPDGRHLYAVGNSALAVFGRDGAAEALDQVEIHLAEAPGVEGLDGAFTVAVSPPSGRR